MNTPSLTSDAPADTQDLVAQITQMSQTAREERDERAAQKEQAVQAQIGRAHV